MIELAKKVGESLAQGVAVEQFDDAKHDPALKYVFPTGRIKQRVVHPKRK